VRNKYPVKISHGLWSNKIDMDAKTQLKTGGVNIPPYPPLRLFIPFGYFFPMSSMNLAFRREATPLMYFSLMGEDPQGNKWGYDRYDDIWCGIIAKKACDILGWAVVNGSPFVEHRKASDVKTNLLKEKDGMGRNENFWKAIDGAEKIIKKTAKPTGIIRALIKRATDKYQNSYFRRYNKAVLTWIELFS
jgi:hypothetical protein